MKTTNRILALVLALIMLMALCACGAKTDETEAAAPAADAAAPAEEAPAEEAVAAEPVPRVLTIGTTTDICSFGPGGNQTERYQCKMIFESLIEYDPQSDSYLPKLAKEYEYLDDYTLKFVIRDDVYFTNGDHLTAADVLYSLKEIWATGTMGTYFECNDWENSYCEDDYTLILKYTDTYGPGLTMFAQWYIYSQAWAESATEEDWFSNPIGTAPYYVSDIAAGSHVTFTRKDAADYWGELPETEEVTYKYYADSSTMFIDFETDKLDAAFNVNATDAARVLAGDYEGIGYAVNSLNDCLNLILSENREIWDDARVREAFMLSLDTNAIAEAAYGVLFAEATSTIPSNVRYYEAQEPYGTDIERAKELLAEAGYEGQTIDLRLVTTNGNETIAEAIQFCASQVGFNISIEVNDPTVAVPIMAAGEVDFMLKETPGGAYLNDPCMLYDNYSPTAFLTASRMTNEEWVGYYHDSLYTIDDDARAAAYASCQEYLHDNFRAVPLCERTSMTVWNTDVIADFYMAVGDEPVVYGITYAG